MTPEKNFFRVFLRDAAVCGSMSFPLHIAFVWHQHQPDYRDPFTGIARLPWTRLHAAKDYLHMAELVAEFPAIHCTFNFVPSLLDQLEQQPRDEWEILSLKESWTRDEKQFLLDHFFSIHPRLLERYPAYVHLRELRSQVAQQINTAELASPDAPQSGHVGAPTPQNFSSGTLDAPDRYFRDLTAWFNLAWTDPRAIQRDPALSALAQKGILSVPELPERSREAAQSKDGGFTREDISAIIARQRELAARVIPFHKELAARGQIEISVTPYYHPILPLLIDQQSAREAMPNAQLPITNFSHPEDAAEQIKRAVSAYQRSFGTLPRGLWPSEGSVSEALMALLPENFQWLATDEGILARSLGIGIERDENGHVKNPRVLYQPYRVTSSKSHVTAVFRDHFLADQISFKYQYLAAQDAANDLVNRLHTIRERLADDEHAYLVPIVMDGENAWEAYENNGDDFFRKLYSLISNDPTLKTVTVTEYLTQFQPRAELSRVAAGSWINSNFDTWIGERAHNRAWELLEQTRRTIIAAKVDADRAKRAWDELYVAEGSDWFWWYSPRNNSGQDKIFDELFRAHLQKIYELVGAPAPQELNEPIRKL